MDCKADFKNFGVFLRVFSGAQKLKKEPPIAKPPSEREVALRSNDGRSLRSYELSKISSVRNLPHPLRGSPLPEGAFR